MKVPLFFPPLWVNRVCCYSKAMPSQKKSFLITIILLKQLKKPETTHFHNLAALAINGVYRPVFWFAAPTLVPNSARRANLQDLKVSYAMARDNLQDASISANRPQTSDGTCGQPKKNRQWVKLIIAMKLELIFVEDLSLWNKSKSLLQELLGTSETLHYTMKAKWTLHMQLSCQRKIRQEQMVCGQSFNLNTLPSKNLQCEGDIPVSVHEADECVICALKSCSSAAWSLRRRSIHHGSYEEHRPLIPQSSEALQSMAEGVARDSSVQYWGVSRKCGSAAATCST